MSKILTIVLVILGLAVAAFLFWPGKICLWGGCKNVDTSINTNSNMILETISPAEFAEKYTELTPSGAVLIDVRTPAEFAAGHYEGAQMIDFYESNFKDNLDKLDKDMQYFIYCRSGARSGQALQLMRTLGFSNVYDLGGGIGGAGEILPIVQ